MSNDFWMGHNGTAGGPADYSAWQQQHLGQLSRAIEDARIPPTTASTSLPPTAQGPVYWGSSTPLRGRTILLLLLVPVIIFVAVVVFNAIDEQIAASSRANRRAREADLQRAADACWRPALARAIVGFDAARDVDASNHTAAMSPCHWQAISNLIQGRRGGVGCLGSDSGPVGSFVDYDRFDVRYQTADPTIQHRLHVMALTPWPLTAGPSSGRDAPVAIAVAQLGFNAMRGRVGQGCVVIAADRIASNLPADGEAASSPDAAEPTAYFSRSAVSVACPAGKALHVVASRLYAKSWQR